MEKIKTEDKKEEVKKKINEIEKESNNEIQISKYKIEKEIDLIRSKLNDIIPFELLSIRDGPGGTKLTYIDGCTTIDLLNHVFGFENWHSFTDSIQENITKSGNNNTFDIMVTARIRLVVKIGGYNITRSDVGIDYKENQRSVGQGYENACKSAVTDGLKRCARQYGNFLGNCLYNKEYIELNKKYKTYLRQLARKGEVKKNTDIYIAPNNLKNTDILKTIRKKRIKNERKKEEESDLMNLIKNQKIDDEYKNMKFDDDDFNQEEIDRLAEEALKNRNELKK